MTENLPPIDSPTTLPGWHMPWPDFAIDWSRSALLLVDLQNYGCNPRVGVAAMLAERYPDIARYYVPRLVEVVIPNARRLLAAFRAAGLPVLFTRHGPLLPDGSDMIARRRRRDTESLAATTTPTLWHRGTFEHAVVDELAPRADELVIDKNTSSAFNSTRAPSKRSPTTSRWASRPACPPASLRVITRESPAPSERIDNGRCC